MTNGVSWRKEGAGTLTAVTLLFLTILAILGTAASTWTSRTTFAVQRYSQRQVTLSTLRAAVREAVQAFEVVVNGDETAAGSQGEERMQELLENMGPIVSFVDDDGTRLLAVPDTDDTSMGTLGTVPIRDWPRAFRSTPRSFRASYRPRWALRGVTLQGLKVTVSPVEIACVFFSQAQGGRGRAGTLSFKGTCSVRGPGGARIERKYELRRRFTIPPGKRARVSFLPAPLGVYVDTAIRKRDGR